MWGLGELFLPLSPASGPMEHPRQALTFPSRATGLGLVSLAWAAGAILSVTLVSHSFTVLSTLCSCISVILALSLCFLLPETHGQLLSDSLEDYSLQRR